MFSFTKNLSVFSPLIPLIHCSYRADFLAFPAVNTKTLINHNRTTQKINAFLRADASALSADNAI